MKNTYLENIAKACKRLSQRRKQGWAGEVGGVVIDESEGTERLSVRRHNRRRECQCPSFIPDTIERAHYNRHFPTNLGMRISLTSW